MSLNTDLKQAVVDNDIEKVKALLKKRAPRAGLHFGSESPDVNFRSPPTGLSLVELAIEAGSEDMAVLLRDAGAKVEPEFKDKFEALVQHSAVVNTTGLEDATPQERQAIAHETNDSFRRLVASSGGKYVLGDVTDSGIYALKDATTGEDVVKPTQSPDGNLSYNVANPTENPEALKALAESKPGKWEIKHASSIEGIRVCIEQMGGTTNLVFNDGDPGIKAIKAQIDAEFVVLYKSEMATHKIANGIKYQSM